MEATPHEFEVASLRELHLLLGEVRIRDATARFHKRLLAFNAFVRFRLRDLDLWPKRLNNLVLIMSDGREGYRPGPGHGHSKTSVHYCIETPQLSGRSDEALVASVGAASDSAFARFVPRASLSVLADEFLSAGCRLSASLRISQTASAALTVFHGMRRVEVRVRVGASEYRVFRGRADDNWTPYLGSVSLNSSRLMIQARTSHSLSLGSAGTGARARRFVVDLRTGQIIQNWELTGLGGVPVPGTGFDRAEPLRSFEGQGGRLLTSLRRPR